MTVRYEWDCELQAVETPDQECEVIDHRFYSFYSSYKRIKEYIEATTPDEGFKFVAVLVRTDDDHRAWAYVEDGKLPEFFLDAYNSEYRRVPKMFHVEVAKAEGATA